MALLSMRQYAKHRGVSAEAVSKAVRTGRISTVTDEKGRRKIDPERADKEWDANSDASKRHHSGPKMADKPNIQAPQPAISAPIEGDNSPDHASIPQSRARSDAIRAAYNAKITALEYQEKLGKLVDADKVRLSAFKTAQAVRSAILNVPNDLAAQLAAETDQKKINLMLSKALTEALEELSRVRPIE